MPEMDQQFLQQQQMLLQEIRDELRATRAQSSSGGMGGSGMGGPNPGHTFVAAQAAADKALTGEWSSFGWAQAYSPTYKSSFMGDLGAMIGFRRSPENMTQDEFRNLAGQNIAARVGSAALGFIAPEYNARTNALADDIYQNSARFIRFGNSNANVMGSGFDMTTARSISRAVQHEALGDLRLSGRDYNTITSLGMQSGQFDNANGVDDFKSKVKELATATGDLTRALHMTVTEVGTAMGNLRQMGVTNVAQQRGIMMQVGGSALVAGMSAPEMMQFSGSIAQQGLSMGLGAQTTMPAAAQTMATIRALSQSGILSPNVMAMGGGAAGVAGQIMHAEMGFAASQGGYLSLLGGGGGIGRNSYDSMLSGLGRAGVGTFEGAVTMGMDRIANMSKVTPDQLENNMRNLMETRMHMMGITDVTSRMAQGMGFQMAKGMGMDDAAALAFTTSQFTSEGRRSSDIAKIQTARATGVREQAVTLDKLESMNSWQGKFRSGVQNVEAGFANVVDAGARTIDRWSGVDAGTKYQAGLNAAITGTGGGQPLDAESLSDAISASGSAQRDAPGGTASLHIRNHDVSSLKALGWGAGSAVVSGALAAGAANFWNPLGWGILGITAVGLGAAAIGGVMGDLYNADGETVVTNDSDVKMMSKGQRALMASNSGIDAKRTAAARKVIASNGLKGEAMERLTATFNRSKMNGSDLKEVSYLMTAVAAENSTAEHRFSVEDVADVMGVMGMHTSTAEMVEVATTGATAKESEAIKKLLGGQDAIGNIASAGGARALGKYVDAVASGKEVTLQMQTDAGAAFGNNTQGYDDFKKRVTGMMNPYRRGLPDERGRAANIEILKQAAAGLTADSATIGRAEFNRTLKGVIALTDSSLGDATLSKEDRAAAQKELDDLKTPGHAFLDVIDHGKIHDLAARGAFGVGGILQTAANVTDESLADKAGETSEQRAKEISDQYHISSQGIAAMLDDPTKRKGLKTFVQASILTSQASAREQQANAPMMEANILAKAADVLTKLDQKLNDK